MTTKRLCPIALVLASGLACSGGAGSSGNPGGAAGSGHSAGASGSSAGGQNSAGAAQNGAGGGEIAGAGAASAGATGGATGSAGAAGAGTAGGATGNNGGSSTSGGSGGGAGGPATSNNVFLYVSGYNDSNIAIYRFDTMTGGLTAMGSAPASSSPTFSVAAASGKFLYVDDESSTATITAYGIASSGALTKMNTVKTSGAGTAHMQISPDGKSIAAADYDSDSINVLGLNADGSLGTVSSTQTGCPSAHNVQFDSSGQFMLAACKSDSGKASPRILQFSFAAGRLTPNTPAAVMFGADPRHMAFDAARKHLYVVTEDSNQLFWFDYDSSAGKISNPQMISALPAGGKVGAGGHIAFGGSFLYVSNRSDNSIGIFSIDASGKPQNGAWQNMGANDVREFSFDPTGKYLIVANETPSQVTVFSMDAGSGKLTPVGAPTSTKSQASAVTIVAVP